MVKRTKKRKKSCKNKTKKVYDKNDFSSGDGMLTSVWGPSLWHFLHPMSFNYPVKPTKEDKQYYMNFIHSLKFILPTAYTPKVGSICISFPAPSVASRYISLIKS